MITIKGIEKDGIIVPKTPIPKDAIRVAFDGINFVVYME